MVVILPAFDPRITVPNTLTGGVNSSDRALLLAQGTAQARAATSLQARFVSRIETALGKLSDAGSTAVTDGLLRDQSQLISRKTRVNQAIEVVGKALSQIEFLKSHIEYLQDQLDELEAANVTAASVAVDWDNKLRKINQLASDASQTIKDGRAYYPKNVIESQSRTTFATQTLYAPYNSDGAALQINGVYLGTDYYISEDGSDDFWNSDTGFAVSEEAVGRLTEYTELAGFPGSPTGSFVDVNAAITAFTFANDSVDVTLGGVHVDGTVTRGGLGLLDAFLYANFDTSLDPQAIDRAQADLQDAQALVLTTQAEFQTSLATMESRVSVFDSLIGAIDTDVANQLRTLQSDREADVLSAQLQFAVASFGFTLLASRGSTLIRSLVLSQDNVTNNPYGETTAMGEFVVGATLNVVA